MASCKASREGIVRVRQAIARKGWKVGSDRWLVEASKILEPQVNWQLDGPYAYGCSFQTWERFLQGVAIREHSFNAFCKILELCPGDVTHSVMTMPNRIYPQFQLCNPLEKSSAASLES